ncbi:MAG: lysostaphin resistance A-like protein [Phycisphaerales bacterium]
MNPEVYVWGGVIGAAVASVWYIARRRVLALPPWRGGRGDALPLILAAVMVYLVAQLAGAMVMAWLAPAAGTAADDGAWLPARGVGLLTGGLVTVVLGAVAWRALGAAEGSERRSALIKRVAAGLVLGMLAGPLLLLVSLASALARRVITGETPDPLAHVLLRLIDQHRESPYTLMIMLCAGVVAPLAEEIVYRGLVHTGLCRALGREGEAPREALLLTAAVFTAVHIPVVPVQALPTLFLLALTLGVARVKTGGLAAPVTIHMGFNLANLAAVWFGAARG